jgi:hypothetical protein
MNKLGEYHAHLDICKQCAEQPFDLCVRGQKLIREAAKESLDEVVKSKVSPKG